MARLDDGPLGAVNAAGLELISQDQATPFTRYQRHVLPLDGYVFWLRTAAPTLVSGSVHVTRDKRQNEDETVAINRVVFTAVEPIQKFNDIGPNHMWVGEIDGVRFAFSRLGPQYNRITGLWHYDGNALYPALESQLVENGAQLSDRDLIVSNSLPAWLGLQFYNPIWLNAPNPEIQLFPSFLVPDNLRPPYGVVHIPPDSTRALQAFPALGHDTTSQHQLAADRVRVTLYGLTNEQVMAFTNLVLQFSQDTNIIGMMDELPIVRDEKRTQAELGILAMKKSVTWLVSYQQQAIRDQARLLILSASATVFPQEFA
jgi:hypothetical protein